MQATAVPDNLKKGIYSLKHLLLAEIISDSFFHACVCGCIFLSADNYQKIIFPNSGHAEQYF